MEQVIEIKGLKKSFNGTTVLSDINLTVNRGENVVILGKSGEGKSVTIKCIAGLMQYDEPTTGLDTITSKEISHLILEMQRKYDTTSVIITHDIPCARITADRVLIMNNGQYIAEGTCDELEHSEDDFIRSFFK